MDLYSSLPVALCASKPIFTPLSRYSTTLTKSASLKLRDVRAGTPVKQRTMSDQHSTSPHRITTLKGREDMKIKKIINWMMISWCSIRFSGSATQAWIKYWITFHPPNLSPPGFNALLSPGQVFLFAVIDAISRTFSTRAPSIPWEIQSDLHCFE